jgi:hypothetical protein
MAAATTQRGIERLAAPALRRIPRRDHGWPVDCTSEVLVEAAKQISSESDAVMHPRK